MGFAWLFAIASPVIEILTIFAAIKNYRKYRIIVDTPTEEIRHLIRGYREIKGKVVALEKILESPLSSIPCVYYEFEVKERRGSGKNARWVTIIEDKGVSKFGIDDGTGIAGVDIMQADLVLKDDTHSQSGYFNPADDVQIAALKKYEKKHKGWIFEKGLKYKETFIEEGDELYVLGDVEILKNDAILLTKKDHALLVSDKSEKELIDSYKLYTIILSVIAVVVPVIAYFCAVSSGIIAKLW